MKNTFITWSVLGLVKDSDVMAVTVLHEVVGEEEELNNEWDLIKF